MFQRIKSKLVKMVIDTKMMNKLIIFSISISVIPLIIVSTILNSKMGAIIGNELYLSYEQIANQYVANMNYKVDIYKTLLANVSSNPSIVEMLAKQDTKYAYEYYEYGKKISKEVGALLGAKNISELHNIMIYSFNTNNPIYGFKISNVEAIENEEWYKVMRSENNFNKNFFYRINKVGKNILSFTKPIVDVSSQKYGNKLGFVKLDIDAQSFFGISNYTKLKNANIYIIDKKGKAVFSNNGSELPEFSDRLINDVINISSGNAYEMVNGKKSIIVYKNISQSDLKALLIFNYSEIEKKTGDVSKLIIVFGLIMMIVIVCISILFSKKWSKRMQVLLDKMEKVENGNMQITEKIQGNDEIGLIDKHFNKMVNELEYLINKNYIQQLQKTESELYALQFQINPHFLYNTLETINSIASINKCFEICEISQKLGEMFRYNINISNSEFISLEKELNHIENYIYIQKIRFKDKFEVFYNVDDEVKGYKVLKFILQPIVENAIVHGFTNSEENGCIEISVSKDKNKLRICVEDDGEGMTQERLDYLNSYINKKDEISLKKFEGSIGIKNVNMRIKLACGDEYGIIYKSKIYEGTQVIFELPLYRNIEEG